jgi:hypothetical protein
VVRASGDQRDNIGFEQDKETKNRRKEIWCKTANCCVDRKNNKVQCWKEWGPNMCVQKLFGIYVFD